MNDQAEAIVLSRAGEALRAHGLTVVLQRKLRSKAHKRADAYIRIGKDKRGIDYLVEVKRRIIPTTLGATLAQLRHAGEAVGRPALVVTDYLTPPMAKQLHAQKQQFADAAGNAYLEGPGLFVFVTGQKLSERHIAPQAGKAFTTAGIKILFALIAEEGLADASYRAIAAAAGVALGTVPAVLADLQTAGYLLVAGKRRRLNATKRLLDDWALAYARTLRPKTLVSRYAAASFDAWREWKLDAKARWGGEPAASLLVRYLKPGVLTIYAEKLSARLIVKQRLVVAGSLAHNHLIEVRRPFWGSTLRDDGRHETAAPALVYGDLLATGDGRCIETAQMIYDGYLARSFPTG
ncbi:MAG: type IV toxin-antitoxin system AbiEi family antitoxin [Betaproteobacteria bacterium]